MPDIVIPSEREDTMNANDYAAAKELSEIPVIDISELVVSERVTPSHGRFTRRHSQWVSSTSPAMALPLS